MGRTRPTAGWLRPDMPVIEDKRALAARIAGATELRDIQIFRISAELLKQPEHGQSLRYEISTDLAATRIDDEMVLAVEETTNLAMWQAPESSDGAGADSGEDESTTGGRTEIASIAVVMGTLYSVAGDDFDYGEDELQAFAETTAQFAMYPFLRQQVHDLTSRLGLPALVLPMLKISLEPEEVTRVHDQRDEGTPPTTNARS